MFTIILTLAALGFLLYLLETFVPMAPPFKSLIRVLVVIAVVVYVFRLLGIADIPMRL